MLSHSFRTKSNIHLINHIRISRTLDFFNLWIDSYWVRDFERVPRVAGMLESFLEELNESGLTDFANRLKLLIIRVRPTCTSASRFVNVLLFWSTCVSFDFVVDSIASGPILCNTNSASLGVQKQVRPSRRTNHVIKNIQEDSWSNNSAWEWRCFTCWHFNKRLCGAVDAARVQHVLRNRRTRIVEQSMVSASKTIFYSIIKTQWIHFKPRAHRANAQVAPKQHVTERTVSVRLSKESKKRFWTCCDDWSIQPTFAVGGDGNCSNDGHERSSDRYQKVYFYCRGMKSAHLLHIWRAHGST